MTIDIVILAAGNSSRMQSSLPKIFHELAGKPIAKYVIDVCENVSHNNIIVVVNDKVKDHEIFKQTKICVQQIANGTGGAVLAVLPEICSEYTMVLCSDMPLVEKKHLKALIDQDSDAAFIASYIPSELSYMPYGRVIKSDEGKFSKIVEYKNASESERKSLLVNSGIYKIKTDLLKKYLNCIKQDSLSGEFYFTDIINILKESHHDVFVIEENDYLPFHGINTMEDLAFAEKIVQNKLRQKFMKTGVRFLDPESVYLSYDSDIESDVEIEQNVVIKRNVVIKKNARIKSFSYLEDSLICEGAIVGPFARLRGNTKLMENSQIGNFVETKGSCIGSNTKIKHLSYIGDASVGSKSNIGAGTITCNYDGVKKYKTSIGNNVMVGSNCSLIAPLKISDNALIGASSVVDRDVSEGSLAISRPKLEIKENKAFEFFNKRQQ